MTGKVLMELKIESADAAFDAGSYQLEVARLLRHAAKRIEECFDDVEEGDEEIYDEGTLFDTNGNRCGEYFLQKVMTPEDWRN